MPCKTVVFLQDSGFLSPLDFRQMGGRAGRRGFDTVGYTVFLGVTEAKVRKLLYSPLPQLETSTLMSVDTALKSLILYSQAKDTSSALNRIRNLFGPCLCTNSIADPSEQHLIFRFSLEFLYQLNLIDSAAKPIGLAGFVSHLSEICPANYALAFLIICGTFDGLCDSYRLPMLVNRSSEAVLARRRTRKEILNVLAHMLFILAPRRTKVLGSLPQKITADLEAYQRFAARMNDNATAIFGRLGFHISLKSLQVDVPEPIDSYLMEFYEHGDIKVLVKDHGYNDSTLYYHLTSFEGVLRKMSTALQQMAPDINQNPFTLALAELSEEYTTAVNNISY
jgi:hypothetical protein